MSRRSQPRPTFALWHRLGLLCALIACHSLATGAEIFGEVYFESVGSAEEIPNQNVTVIVQDRDGFLWVGTPNGLFRYDGYRFLRIGTDPNSERSLGGVFIRSLLADSHGRIWVGTDAHGLSMLDPATGAYVHYQHEALDSGSLAHDSVLALVEDHGGRIWVGTRRGLDRVDPDTGGIEHISAGPLALGVEADTRILALLVDQRGDLWIGSWNGLMRRHANGGLIERMFSSTEASDPLAAQQVRSINALANGRIGIGTTRRGAFVVSADAEQLRPIDMSGEGAWNNADPLVMGMLQPGPEEIWLAGYGGVVVVDSERLKIRRYIRRDPFGASDLVLAHVRSMIQDRSGDVWLGGFGGGLQRHNPANQAVRVVHAGYNRDGSLSSADVGSVLELANGEIWIGTRDNGVDVFDRRRGLLSGIRMRGAADGVLSSAEVSALAQTGDGSVWVGTIAGLNRVDPAQHSLMPVAGLEVLRHATVRRLLAGDNGELWIGSNVGLATWSPASNRIELLSSIGGDTFSGDINALVLDPDGRLWIGCGSVGLFTLAPGASQLRSIDMRIGATLNPPLSIVGMLRDREGRLWIDTSEGLYRAAAWNGSELALENISARLEIFGKPFGANLLEDAQGRIWTQDYVLDPTSMQVRALTRGDGVNIGTPWFRSYTRTRDGLMLFGGSKGLLVIDPAAFKPATYAAPLRITEVRLDGTLQPIGRTLPQIVMSPETRILSVEFAALDFAAAKRRHYRYRLLGYDEEWTSVDHDHRLASYGGLAPGDYVLQIRGSTRSGMATANGIDLPVVVQAAFWQTLWFKLLLGALAVALVHAGYQFRSARMQRHAQRLERLILERTGELQEAKSRAEAALVELKGAQRQLVAAEKMASLGTLVAGVAHEINTPLGVSVTAASHLQSELRSLERSFANAPPTPAGIKAFTELAGLCTEMILRNLERTDRLVRTFKRVSVDPSRESLREIRLVSLLEQLALGLQPGQQLGSHELVIDCPGDLAMCTYPDAITAVLNNLIANSLSHGFAHKSGGVIRIVAGPGTATAEGMPMVHIRYSDNGRGMPADVLARAFDPFFTTNRGQGGTGLGMHIAYNLVSLLLRGTIHCESTPGNGVHIDIEIPQFCR